MCDPRFPRYWLHRLFAYPFHICWVIGTTAIWIPMTLQFAEAGVFGALTGHWSTALIFLLSYAATSGFGFIVAVLCIGWLVLPICRYMNGAPHEIGDSVVVLSGPFSGRVASIYVIGIGQGGVPVPRVDLGTEARIGHRDMFEEYALLRTYPRRARFRA